MLQKERQLYQEKKKMYPLTSAYCRATMECIPGPTAKPRFFTFGISTCGYTNTWREI